MAKPEKRSSAKRVTLKTWRVIFTLKRTVALRAPSAYAAEKVARSKVFKEKKPTYADVTDTNIGWLDEYDINHVVGCYGHHCHHYDCEADKDMAEDYHEYCSQCDVDAH